MIGMMFMEKVKEFVIYNKRNAQVHLNGAFFNILLFKSFKLMIRNYITDECEYNSCKVLP